MNKRNLVHNLYGGIKKVLYNLEEVWYNSDIFTNGLLQTKKLQYQASKYGLSAYLISFDDFFHIHLDSTSWKEMAKYEVNSV